jgi:hypothetical protein
MKQLIMAALVTMTLSGAAQAYQYHIPSGRMVEVSKFDKDGNAYFFDYETHKKVYVKAAELSYESKTAVNGIKAGDVVLHNQKDVKFCEVFHVFENGLAYVGCQSESKMAGNLGVDRPSQLRGFVDTKTLIGEVKELDGFSKKEKASLLKDSGKLKCGNSVRIEAILSNGEAIVQKRDAFSVIDSSSLRLKLGVERVPLTELAKRD